MENATSKDVEAASLLGLADLSLATVKDLKNRLLGNLHQNFLGCPRKA